jgi:hypothetical protein
MASGGTAPYTYALTAGSLPPGLGLGASTGAITGTPRDTGPYSFTARVTDHVAATATVACSVSVLIPQFTPQAFTLQKLCVAMKKDPKLPVRGAAQ